MKINVIYHELWHREVQVDIPDDTDLTNPSDIFDKLDKVKKSKEIPISFDYDYLTGTTVIDEESNVLAEEEL